MPAQRDLSVLSRAVLVGGALALLIAIGLYATAPEELPRASEGWFESVDARSDRTTPAVFLAMLGIFLILVGASLSRRGRAMTNALAAEQAQAMATGVVGGLASPEERLARLDDLRARGVLTDDEHRIKRAEIVAEL